MSVIRRREFIALLGGAAVACPLTARAQQERERVRRVGILLPASSDDLDYQGWVGAFLQGLQQSRLDHRPQPAHRHALGHDQCRVAPQARD